MRRTDWILGFALIVVLIGVVFLGIFFWQQSNLVLEVTPNAGAAVTVQTNANRAVDGRTSIVAFGAAQNITRSWQTDAVLVSAKATWAPNVPIDAMLTGSEDWSFTFYSPSAREAVNVLVTRSNTTISDPYAVRNQFDPLWVSGWKVNSDEAVRIFMENGGATLFTIDLDVLLTMQLSTVSDSGKIEWFVTGLSDRTGRGISIVIDATSGEILDVFRDS